MFSRTDKVESGKTKYIDKSSFVFQDIKRLEENDLNSPIEKTTKLYQDLLDELIEISLNVLVNYYATTKKVAIEGSLKEASNVRRDLPNFITSNLFKINNKDVNSISFGDLDKHFEKDPYVSLLLIQFLTPGFFRESAFELVKIKNLEKAQHKNEEKTTDNEKKEEKK